VKNFAAVVVLLLLAACQSGPKPEDDVRYVKLAKVVDVHVYTDAERKEARLRRPSDSKVSIGIGIGVGTGGLNNEYDGWLFGGGMFGGGMLGDDYHRKEPPRIDKGANRYTVETVEKGERFEVLSYGKYNVGDCVKVLMGHPTEYARLFDLKAGEHCN
jgi:hypothetical protein